MSALTDEAAPIERAVFRTPVVAVGDVRCAADHPSFASASRVAGYRFVFPRHSVWIETARDRRYVSDASVVEYYNDGEEFGRHAIDPRGDRTDWYEVDEAALRDVVRRYDPSAADAPCPFRFTHGPTDHGAYLAQRTLAGQMSRGCPVPSLQVEETVLDLLDRVLARAYRAQPPRQHRDNTSDEQEIADRASAVLSRMTSGHATLTAIGRATGVSAFHLSRIFRKVTGRTLAKHHLHLRLLASLTPLGESNDHIARIARNHGFVTHSHYTSAFHRVFGVTPSSYRGLSTLPRRRVADAAL